jgi:regulator of cell morphogenesis and NO signaling
MYTKEELESKTVGEIVATNFAAAATFDRHGIDFCCGGNIAVAKACADKNVALDTVLNELEAVLQEPVSGAERFELWNLDFLADYILQNHHTYIREKSPLIRTFAEKVVNAHAKNHPEVLGIASLFAEISNELDAHLMKEERILFPRIKQLAIASREGNGIPGFLPGSISNPILVMETEHTNAGDLFREISLLSNGYVPPQDACNTFKALYFELQAFENDLHKHIHLENNILFPKSIQLEAEFTK